MNYKECDGVYTCVDGSFDCENCTLVSGVGSKQPKAPIKKPKHAHAPQKQFKRRKK